MTRELVSRWFGAFWVEDGRVVGSRLAPSDVDALTARLRQRRAGHRTPEEELLLRDLVPGAVSRDRRLVPPTRLGRAAGPSPPETRAPTIDETAWRELLIAEAEHDLAASWDPSVHLSEAIWAITELEQAANLVGERLRSWAGRDRIGLGEEDGGNAEQISRALAEGGGPSPDLPGAEPELLAARRGLAELFLQIGRARAHVEQALEGSVPRRMPNLNALLGPLLAARMVAQAGGLDRLARLPASTVQVLGAERAFFEHLRGRAPPPRHGWLFQHPDIQSAPKRLRGKLARALAGKVAIAARLDHAGRPMQESVRSAFEARARELRSAPGRRGGPGERRSRAPLHRAAQHR